jgi:pre-mRNA-processing factor SLU7
MPPTNAPPPQDTSRNEYIPSFISQRPFYVTDDLVPESDYLEHQRLHSLPKDTLSTAKWYNRGSKTGPAATKFRKGACANCGAMTHKTKECLSRPRKTGAKFSGKDIQADERVESVELGWDAKRDRWNGYDAREYDAVIKEYNELEALKKAAGGEKDKDKDTAEGVESPAPDSDRYEAETDMGRSQPTSTRQLRLREDTAAYLRNLDLESARYDPKTRSMDTETKSLANESGDLADQGFMRPSEAEAFERAQRYAWEAGESGAPGAARLHLQANPTEGALLLKKAEAEAEAKKDAKKKYLADRYGGSTSESHSAGKSSTAVMPPPKPKAITSSSSYVEYDSTGRPLNAPTPTTAKSKYAEDIHPNNHTSVFGSWWEGGTWGYACCHSSVRNSWCAGAEGIEAFTEERERKGGFGLLEAPSATGEEESGNGEGSEGGGGDGGSRGTKRCRENVRGAGAGSGISEEEMESYKRSKMSAQDPMGAMLGKDELLEGS